MNSDSHNSMNGTGTGEDTLRLIAGLPAPDGLEGRVHKALRAAPRQGRVLAWPFALRADATWVRAAAAAAIVMVVAGGGWGVFSHIQPWQAAKTPAVSARVGAAGGFSGASAESTPKTLEGPVVTAPGKPVAAPIAATGKRKAGHAHPVRPGNSAGARPVVQDPAQKP